MTRSPAAGFSLIELIVAITLSMVVLTSVATIVANLMRAQFMGARRGEVSGMTLYAVEEMHRRVSQGTYLISPAAGAPGNTLTFCTNWSNLMPGADKRLDATRPAEWYTYCLSGGTCPPGYAGAACYSLWRYNGAGCAPVGVACGGGAASEMPVVVNNVFFSRQPNGSFSNYLFRREDSIGGVEMHYIVGIATASANRPQPVAYYADQKIPMSKAYNNVSD